MTAVEHSSPASGLRPINATVRLQVFKTYPDDYKFIPLHRWDAKSRDRAGKIRADGKRPRDKNWTTRNYDREDLLRTCVRDNRNIGIRLKRGQLVIDIDPRNGGNEGFAKLCKDLGLRPSKWPRDNTGSGGFHYYLKKPADIPVLDTLEKYKGVEFKSHGRQVVAAGSIHPNGKPYLWDLQHPDISLAPDAPAALLEAIRRPNRESVSGGGQYTQEQIARALEVLDPTDYSDHDKWLRLMMACHHASAGDAREEYVEWSCSDPQYSQDADVIGRRWDSLHTDKNDGVTYRTLNKVLADAGHADLQPIPDASDDFDDEDEKPDFDFDTPAEDDFDFDPAAEEDDVETPADKPSRLLTLNARFVAVLSYGRYRIMYREHHSGGQRWAAVSKQDFMSRFENEWIEDGNKAVPVGEAWQKWGHRKTADGTCFDTGAEPAAIVRGRLNLWSGLRIKPSAGNCSLFLRMIRDDLCSGDECSFNYVIRWIAWKFQNPGELPETSVALIGEKGTGKTTLGETIVYLFGEHGMAVDSIEKIAGKFNGHLETKCFVYADEAVWGGDKANEGALKKLITDREVSYEYKGVQTFTGVNHVGLMFAGNEKWVVPATMDERRFCVLQVSSVHRVPDDAGDDHPNRQYWNAIHRELGSGGRAAFLHMMLTMDLGNWHPREGVPRTEALGQQKFLGLKGASKFYFECLQNGSLPIDMVDEGFDDGCNWETGTLEVNPTQLTSAYAAWTHAFNRHANVSARGLLFELKAFGWRTGRKPTAKRERFWLAPALPDARRIFSERIGFNPFRGADT